MLRNCLLLSIFHDVFFEVDPNVAALGKLMPQLYLDNTVRYELNICWLEPIVEGVAVCSL